VNVDAVDGPVARHLTFVLPATGSIDCAMRSAHEVGGDADWHTQVWRLRGQVRI
jgi:hypothetical protein